MIIVAIAQISTNMAANVVSPANDFSNLNPRRISYVTGGLITAVLGILTLIVALRVVQHWQRASALARPASETAVVSALLEGLSAAEVAELTGLSVLAVYNRIRSLRRSFKTWTARQEGDR